MSDTTSKGFALVTGASTGIGAVYADRLAKRGYDLILVARDETRLTALAERLKADLTDRADLAKVEERLATDTAITLLLNNAGAAHFGGFETVERDAHEKLIALNVLAVTRLAAAAAANFVPRDTGTIINISSVVGLVPEFKSPVYGATKAFVTYLTQGLRVEYASSKLRLQAVLPGATRTEIWERSGADLSAADPETVMDVADLVDAALAGLDQGELITIPSLPDAADFDAFNAARLKMAPNLSRRTPATRFKAQ